MFKTKRDVDRHVLHILNRIREEKERNARGFQFAKLYYDIAEHDSAKRYLQAFISVRETVPQAHKLMGQIHEAQRDRTRAVESFKRSLELDPEQNDLILKVCELYCDPSVTVNPEIAKYWIDQAEKYYPSNYSVFKLKERMVGRDGQGDKVELEQLISGELLKNPSDVQLHVKLLQLYIENREVDRAYDHAIQTEKTLAFVSSIDWYECLVNTFQVYEDQSGGPGDAMCHTHRLFAVASLTHLRLQADDREIPSCVKAIHQLDEGLRAAGQVRRYGPDWEAFLGEIKGQLFFLIATLLLKRAAKGQIAWKDACSYSAVCYLLSDSLPAIDVKSSWVSQLPQDRKKFYDRVYMTGCDRLSQGGHMIYALMSKQDGGQWARKLRQRICTPQGKETLYSLVFTTDKFQRQKDKSYLIQSGIFTETNLDVPSLSQIVLYDSVAYALHCDNLKHVVWLCLRHYNLTDEVQPDYEQLFGFQPFKDMKYSVPDLSGGDPGSLCQLDVQVFMYACVRWSAEQQREARRNLHAIPDKPPLLPVCLDVSVCSRQQCGWWSAVHRMETKTASEKLSKLWGVVMRGLETIRLVSPNTLTLSLIVHVARTLDTRAKEIESLDAEGIVTRKLSTMQDRASFYWKSASDLLNRINRNQAVKLPKESLFPGEMVPDAAVTKETMEQVTFAMATVAMREERYEDALKGFEMLYQPEASYSMGLIYQKLAESMDMNTNSLTSPQSSREVALLTKAKNSLYQALDRLGTDKNQVLKDAISRELDDVACRLISAETAGVSLIDSIVTNNSQNYSTAESDVDVDDTPIKPLPLPPTPVLPQLTRKEQPIYPSPTRLDVQLKSIETVHQAHSSRMSSVEETVRTNQKLIQELIVQLRESRDENRNLRDQLQMMSYQQGLAGMSMSRGTMPPFPGTPQSRPMMNQSFGTPQYDLHCPGAIPNHMSQYGYQPGMASPSRPGSQFANQDLEDELRNIDGEYYDPDAQGQYYVPDSNLVQDWPFGNEAGVEGKSTITYSPQGRPTHSNANMANALRGPSIQYSGYQQPQGPAQGQLPMPGPGFFAQNRQPEPQGSSGFLGQTPGLGLIGTSPSRGRSPAMSPSMHQPTSFPTPNTSQPAKPPMMPPNAVASPSVEVKPRLIPGSVGVPTPQKDDKAAAGVAGPSPLVAAGVADSQKTASMTPPSGTTQGAASSMLSAFAAKHQGDKQQTTPTTIQTPQTTQTPQKTVFQGFSFTSTPKISEPKEDKSAKTDTKTIPAAPTAPKPFSSFSLTPSAPSTDAASPQAKPAGKQTTQQPQSTGSPFTLGQGTPALSFGSLTSSSTDAFKASGDFQGFQGTGQQMFSGKSPSPRKGNRTLSEDDKVDEYEPNVDFKPVVELPDLVVVKTGEEDELKLFGERAKLFRFDTESNQWKERGIGEFKLLKHKETGRVRILMRREQVLKLCANHAITKTMKFSPMSTSDKTWCWHAMDYAEEEMKMENFAIKFKSAQSAQKFKDIFEKCQAELPTDEPDASEKSNKPPVSKPAKGDLAGMFKQQAGSWKCDGCLITNESDNVKCPCCNSLKPGVKADDVKDSKQQGFGQASAAGFTFGGAASSKESSGFTFGSQPQSDNQSAASSKTGSGFTFGSQPKADNQSAGTPQPGSGFMFGSQSQADKPPSVDSKDKAKEADKTKTGGGSLSSLFKTSDGSWKCDGCLISNTANILKCPCCGTMKPGAKPEDVKDSKQQGQAATDTKPGGFTFGSQPQSGSQPSGFTFGSQSGSQPSGFKFGSQPQSGAQPFGFMKSSQKSETAEENTAKTADISFPEACKPDVKQGPKFSFGGEKSTLEPSTIASRAGFNVNKNENKYTFDKDAKGSTQTEDKSNSIATVEEESILLQLIKAAPGGKVEEVQETKGPQAEPTKVRGVNVDNVGSKDIGSFGIGKDDLQNTEQKSEGFVFGSATAGNSGFAFGSANKQEGFKFSLDQTTDQKAATEEGFNFKPSKDKSESGFNFSFTMTPTSKSVAPKSPGIKSPQSPEVDKDGMYITKEGEDSHIYFEPVIALPDTVDVVTGEEEEDALFDQRAKLYRFYNGEWRERGLGNMKVLYCQNSNKTRILMRREHILKICCNHCISPELKLNPMPNSDGRALVWFAMDFADDEPRPEQFSIRFKTAEIAKEFEKTVEAAKHVGTDSKYPASPKVETVGALSTNMQDVTDSNDIIFVKEETATSHEIEKARQLQLPDNFYMYSRRPSCPGCIGCTDGEGMLEGHGEMVDRTEDDTVEYDDDEEEEEDSEEYETEEEETDEGEAENGSQAPKSGTTYLAKLLTQEGGADGFAPKPTGNLFAPKPNLFAPKPTGNLFAGALETEQASTTAEGEAAADEAFVFGGGRASGFSFASLAASADPKAFSPDSDPIKPFHWQGAGKQLFGAGVAGGDGAGYEDEGVQQGDDPHFEPIVPLPDLIDVRTGEEDEAVEFSNRAKLFRFDKEANQWKEKGIGEMKILRHRETGKYRFLLRREQVYKLACNHMLTGDLAVTRLNTSETSWCWTAQDYSDTEPRVEQLAVKFKTIELAEKFKEKVDGIQEMLRSGGS